MGLEGPCTPGDLRSPVLEGPQARPEVIPGGLRPPVTGPSFFQKGRGS